VATLLLLLIVLMLGYDPSSGPLSVWGTTMEGLLDPAYSSWIPDTQMVSGVSIARTPNPQVIEEVMLQSIPLPSSPMYLHGFWE
jgi:hypothetical protein